jgi:cytochrome c oxidase subunit 2
MRALLALFLRTAEALCFAERVPSSMRARRLLVLISFMLVSVSARAQQSVLDAAGPQARHIARLFWSYLSVSAAVCLLVLIAVCLAIWRRRERGAAPPPALAEDALPPHPTAISVQRLDPARERKRLRSVQISTLATLAALFALLSESVVTGNALDSLSGRKALHIEVTGKQWWWDIRYRADDASQRLATANELHVPVGRPIVLHLAASDVIHSIWFPNLHGKRDLIPGRQTTLVLQVDRPGSYRSQCAEFCGLSHAQMALWLIAESPQQYEAWRAQQLQSAREPATPDEQLGRQVFLASACPLCHAIAGTPAQATVGPDLTHLASRHWIAAATWPNRRGFLTGWLLGSQALKPGNHMPNISLAPRDLHALTAYLEALR